jgi:hypothetical protein
MSDTTARSEVESLYQGILDDLNNVFIAGMDENFENNERFKELTVEYSKLKAQTDSANALATNAQIFSFDRYLADLKLDFEPSIKVVEVPIDKKVVTILDNPPNKAIVAPTYIKDASSRLVFNLKHDVFSYKNLLYPGPITQQDIANEATYKNSKDLIDNSKIGEKTVSFSEFLEVFMLDKRPESLEDFSGNSISTIDMKAEDGNIYSEKALYITVEQNIKKYFAFRFINSNGISGPLSQIYECELVNDGGYRYGSFNVVDLDDKVDMKQSSTEFKKLFTLVPKSSQMSLNLEKVEFGPDDTAKAQISNVVLGDDIEDKIWGKTFKIRLTSKKTQKRLDLNITFERQEKI